MNKLKRNAGACICILLCFLLYIPAFASESPRRVKVGYYFFNGYHMMDEDGSKSGYGYEYLQYMSSYANWTYDYIGFEKGWADMQKMLEIGEIDLLTSAHKTPEREARFAFSDEPIGYSSVIFTVKAGDTRYLSGDYDGYNGIRVGMVEGSTRNDKFQTFAQEHNFTYTPVYFQNTLELADALQENDLIDAIVTSNLRRTEREWVLDEFASSPFYVIVRKDDTQLLAEVNTAIESVKRYHSGLEDDLLQKYYTPSTGNDIPFTAAERRYLQEVKGNGKTFKVILNPDRAPLSWFDHGKAKGVFAQLGKDVLERAGLPYEIIETNNRQEYQELCISGDYDIALDANVDFNEAEALGYKLTQPYMTASVFQLNKKNFSQNVTSIAALKGADITTEFIEKTFPLEYITYYDTVDDCANAVLDGKVDATYFYTYVVQSVIYNDATGQLVSSEVPGYSTDFAFSVRNTQDFRLLSILNKTLASFNDEELNQIISTGVQYPQKEQTLGSFLYSHPLTLVSIITFLAILTLIIVILLFKNKNRKHEQARLNEYERFISYVCKMNDLVLEVDLNTQRSWYYTTENGKVSKTEISEEQLKELSGTLHQEDAKKLTDKLQKASLDDLVKHASEFYFECRVQRNTPEPHWYAFTFQGLARDALHPNSILILGHDIDTAKKEEDERHRILQDALAAAQQASETKSSFLSRMSHEMRTPLNAIIGYLELGKTHSNDPEKLEDYMSKSDVAAHQLLSIINDVLDMASIESGKLHLERVQFEMTEEIQSVRKMFETQAWNKNLDFQVHLDSNKKVHIMGDPLRLNQILINLLSNAIKFTPPHGRVTLNVYQTAQLDDRVYYCFEVADTGIGMSEEFLTNLFNPFEQHDSSIARKYGGSGLGMSITKNLVNMKQGTITVNSELGRGTIFTVNLSFDLVQNVEDIPSKASENVRYDFTGMSLLLAEDNQMNREIATEILTSSGFKVNCAENGKQAVDKFLASSAGTYQLILMDIQMPIMNGYEAAEKIRASNHPQSKNIPIFAMTANAFAEDVNKALAVGMNGHIAKPLDVKKMLEVLSACLKE